MINRYPLVLHGQTLSITSTALIIVPRSSDKWHPTVCVPHRIKLFISMKTLYTLTYSKISPVVQMPVLSSSSYFALSICQTLCFSFQVILSKFWILFYCFPLYLVTHTSCWISGAHNRWTPVFLWAHQKNKYFSEMIFTNKYQYSPFS